MSEYLKQMAQEEAKTQLQKLKKPAVVKQNTKIVSQIDKITEKPVPILQQPVKPSVRQSLRSSGF